MDVINTMVLIVFNLVVIGLLVWFVGSLALRFAGWGWIAFGLAVVIGGASSGEATLGTYALGLFNIGLGVTFWACGHALYRVRRGHWKSTLMHRIAAIGRPMRHAGRPDFTARTSGRLP